MGFSNTGNLARCASYEDARALFKTPTPKHKDWHDSERPLGTNQQYHYRVVRANDIDCYRVWLYSTCMAQFYAPEGNERRIKYEWDHRPTSTSFMWYVVRTRTTFETTDGRKVKIPVERGGVDLVLVDGKLDISRSTHNPDVVYHMSDHDKQRAADLRQFLAPIVQLAAIRWKDVRVPKGNGLSMLRWEFGAFKKAEVSYSDVREFATDPTSPEGIESFMECARKIAIFAKGRAAYNERPEPGVAQLEKAMMTWALKKLSADRKSKRVELPLFPEVE